MDMLKDTEQTYGFLWSKSKDIRFVCEWHFNNMQEVINEPIVRGRKGIDLGSGCGYDTFTMASRNPSVDIVSVDLSDGVYKTKELTAGLDNVMIIKCSVLNIPIRDDTFDFAYSFGVLHHTISPERGLLEVVRVLKKGSPAFLYLYEDHSEHPLKYLAVKMITLLRIITTRLPLNILYVLCWIFSPLVFILFTFPALALKRFKRAQHLAKNIPFNFGTSIFSLRDDLYDRFRAPIEFRFSSKGVYKLFNECGFGRINITSLKDSAGWVVWGYKK